MGNMAKVNMLACRFAYINDSESSPGSSADGQCIIEQSGPKYSASCVWPKPSPTFRGAY